MKVLDKYILTTYLKTFFSVFIILMFIFILQSIWLYISELAGRGLDLLIVLKFLWYVSPRLIPLVLPLTILVTSLMVFGSFSENYEFAAMKSTGISLQRAMKSLTVFIVLLSVLVFFFANNVIPYSEYKWLNLRRNIQQFKPSMVIAEGQFSQIGDGFNIKVDEKSGDNDQYLSNIVIHQKDAKRISGNHTVIIADNGELTSEEGSNTLSLVLKDGNYYSEVQTKDVVKRKREPFVRSYFEEYIINIDLTELNNKDVEKENKLNSQNMFNVSELRAEIDSQSQRYNNTVKAFSNNMYYRAGMAKFHEKKKNSVLFNKNKDSLVFKAKDTLLHLFNAKHQASIVKLALNNIKSTLQSVDSKKKEYVLKTKRLNQFEIALHEKYVLPLACIILFFVGAPLGAIIRKGGLGLPMVIAILLFLTYHFIGIFAKNSAEDGTLSPFIAAWTSTMVTLPLGIWLTYRATTDQGIIDMGAFLNRFKWFSKSDSEEINSTENKVLLTQQEKAFILSKDEEQLKDILKNYRQYNYSEDIRLSALQRLKEFGYNEQQLKVSGDYENLNYSNAVKSYKEFSKNSKIALVLYFTILTLLLLMIINIILDIQISESVFIISDYISIISILLFYFFAIKAFLNHYNFYNKINKKREFGFIFLFIILGPLIYAILHYTFKNKMKEELENIS